MRLTQVLPLRVESKSGYGESDPSVNEVLFTASRDVGGDFSEWMVGMDR